jgi:catechol 2,3-dioxygenase-like lactoylglutathione lyase family enzyme
MTRPCGVSHVAVVTADLDGFRAFYEDTIGLETMLVLAAGPGHARQAVLVAGDVLLHAFEVPGYDPAAHGIAAAMFERGRLDHLGFTVVDEAALQVMRDRLLEVGASSGDIRRLGPMLSLRFRDPEGFEGEVNCLDPTYDPAATRIGDEIVDPHWFERTTRVLRAPSPTPRSKP